MFGVVIACVWEVLVWGCSSVCGGVVVCLGVVVRVGGNNVCGGVMCVGGSCLCVWGVVYRG